MRGECYFGLLWLVWGAAPDSSFDVGGGPGGPGPTKDINERVLSPRNKRDSHRLSPIIMIDPYVSVTQAKRIFIVVVSWSYSPSQRLRSRDFVTPIPRIIVLFQCSGTFNFWDLFLRVFDFDVTEEITTRTLH